uniref:Ig-like domain-containing protein n=1 Tax=Ficedula albicollis TaxID=59894 RepID=U3JRK5_FICAL
MGCEGGGLCTSVVVFFFPNSMTTVIVILAAVTTLIIVFGVSGKQSISPTALTSPGSIGQCSILGCTFKPDIQMDSTAIQWAKEGVAGLLHEFKGGKDHLQDIPVVQVENRSHGDTLQCEALHWFPCPAVHWMAYGETGEHLPHTANTRYELNPENITVRVVSLLHNITAPAIYTCVIENSIAKAMGNIRVTDLSVTKVTNLQLVNLNAESVSSSFPACHWMLLLPLYLLST